MLDSLLFLERVIGIMSHFFFKKKTKVEQTWEEACKPSYSSPQLSQTVYYKYSVSFLSNS